MNVTIVQKTDLKWPCKLINNTRKTKNIKIPLKKTIGQRNSNYLDPNIFKFFQQNLQKGNLINSKRF